MTQDAVNSMRGVAEALAMDGKSFKTFVKTGAMAFAKLMIWFVVISTGLFFVGMIIKKAWPFLVDFLYYHNLQICILANNIAV